MKLHSEKTLAVHALKVSHGFIKNYCYLVVDELTRDAVLIDPAWEMDKIEAKMLQCEATLKAVLLTHHHFDHVHLSSSFAEQYRVPAYMSKVEIDSYGFSCPNLTAITTETLIKIGSLPVTPIFTPGHTKGAICYWIGDALFTGDTLFIEGCGICTGKGACPSAMFDSLRLLKNQLPADTMIYPGHSYGHEPGQTFAFVGNQNIYLSFDNKKKFIDFRMRKGQGNLFKFV